MKLQKKLCRMIAVALLAINMMVLPVLAADEVVTCVEPRYNNVFSATLALGFDSNHVAYCELSLNPYANCTGFDGIMRLYDSTGTQLKSWSISDYDSPYCVEKTWQCKYGETYTLSFQGYAYGTGSTYDDINLSLSDICD